MTYSEQGDRIIKLALEQGYTAINIDYAGPKVGQKPSGYEVTALEGNRVRILIAWASSWKKCYAEAIEYLSEEVGKPLIEILA